MKSLDSKEYVQKRIVTNCEKIVIRLHYLAFLIKMVSVWFPFLATNVSPHNIMLLKANTSLFKQTI